MNETKEIKLRPSWDVYFMQIATVAASRSTCDRKHVGCVVVKDRRILSTGYNGSPRGLPHCDDVGHELKEMGGRQSCVRTIHAEINAIAQAATSGTSIEGSTAYVTAMPCYDCAKALINAGIKTVVYGEFYASRYGKSDDVVAFLTEAKVNVKHIVPRPVNPVPRVLHMPRNELAGAIEVGATAGCVVVVTEPDGSKTVVDALGDAA